MSLGRKIFCSVVALGIFSCADTSTEPGRGDGFTSTHTAEYLFNLVSFHLNVPADLVGDQTFESGSTDCSTGGTVSVETSKAGILEDGEITFFGCEQTIGADNVTLAATGKVFYHYEIDDGDSSPSGTLFYRQQMSFSGDIGFAADCNFTISFTDLTTTDTHRLTGECTYTDSEDVQRKIDAEGMLDVIQDQ